MDKMKAKRENRVDLQDIAVQRWPNKKAASSQKMEKIQSPKF
jgi:hypothetical protein